MEIHNNKYICVCIVLFKDDTGNGNRMTLFSPADVSFLSLYCRYSGAKKKMDKKKINHTQI